MTEQGDAPGPGALQGLHILDAASMLAAPYGATLLGDLGADVIKLEPPNGDETRRMGPRIGTDSGVFVGVNRNKRSVALDLRTDDGQTALAALLEWADVLVENLRPQARAKLGLDPTVLKERYPRLVTVSVSTFGEHGPYAGRAGIDPVAQALSGFMSVTGEEGGGPLKAGPPIGDAVTSLLVAVGMMAALWARERTGEGQHVSVALIDGLIHVQAPYTGQYFLLGRQQPRMGNSIDWYAPYNSYECGDGLHLQLACFNDKFFANLCAALGQRELVTDARFATNDARLEHRHDLDAIIGAFCLARPRAEVLDQLWAHDSIAGPIHTYEDVFSDPQVLANEMVVEVPHHRGPLRVTGVPVHLDETPGSVRRPPPGLGEHSREVLEELHLDPDLIDRLVRRDTP